MISFVNVYNMDLDVSKRVLYDLLMERTPNQSISHRYTSFDDHCRFFDSRPYRIWNLVKAVGEEDFVGAMYISHQNEIGLFIFSRFQGRGYGREAVQQILESYRPSPGKKSIVSDSFILNVSVNNIGAQKFWESVGARPVQVSYTI